MKSDGGDRISVCKFLSVLNLEGMLAQDGQATDTSFRSTRQSDHWIRLRKPTAESIKEANDIIQCFVL